MKYKQNMSVEKLDLQSPDIVNENFEKLAPIPKLCNRRLGGQGYRLRFAKARVESCCDRGQQRTI